MKTRNPPPPGSPRGRRIAGRAQSDHVVDTYKLRKKLAEPSRCPECGAVYHDGRWQWMKRPPADAREEMCTACQRVRDDYPAGIVTLVGAFIEANRTELTRIARNQEEAERGEHPMNRIMTIGETEPDTLVITTTDVHLPRRIGEAIHRAFHGDLKIHYDEDRYFVRVDWERQR